METFHCGIPYFLSYYNLIHRLQLTASHVDDGSDPNPNLYPWTVMIKVGNKLACSGALITDRHVLAAAHLSSIKRAAPLKVNVAKVLVHELYDQDSTENDIAIIRLERAIPVDTYIRPICQPDPIDSYAGQNGLDVEWVDKVELGLVLSEIRQLSLPILSNEQCQSSFGAGVIPDNLLCAGPPIEGAGAGAGVLFAGRKDRAARYNLVGLVSLRRRVSLKQTISSPSVYTRVSTYHDWIQSNTYDGCQCEL
ncbi:transmembrane protease serine 11D-like [Uranotaenia lowii]|uniref:transmembrane protease serine 11D-like n=1 Tax=Uranotaenia lowii TaxID=190385 RepID=UPI002479E483|nr:transmembrane protease serine 11D-like [Uranotaenia lowii]